MTTLVRVTHCGDNPDTVLGYRLIVPGDEQGGFLQPLGAGQHVDVELDEGSDLLIREFFGEESRNLDLFDGDEAE